MIGDIIDNMISIVSPSWALQRTSARIIMRDLKSGEINRLNKNNAPKNRSTNPLPADATMSSARARKLFDDDPRVSKAVRFIGSKVVGCGMKPQSLANEVKTGKPWLKFRSAAEGLWSAVQRQLCYEGVPGRGGMTIDGMAIANLNETIITGDGVTKEVPLTPEQAKNEGRILPLAFTLVSSNQFVEDNAYGFKIGSVTSGNRIYRGIELGPNNRRIAYHLYDNDPFDSTGSFAAYPMSSRFDSDKIIHTFVQPYGGRVRGLTWLSPVLQNIKDADELLENELFSQKAAACVMGAIIRRRPGPSIPGLPAPTNGSNSDSDGTQHTRIQPGLMLNLSEGDDFKGFNPNRNASDVGTIAGLVLRGAAAGIRCMKSSAMTMDYERASWSSEKASDNDTWSEIEMTQDWYSDSWYQPIYRRVIEEGINVGWFDSVSSGGPVEQFRAMLVRNIDQLANASWQGPVQKWLQPAAEENASATAVRIGTSNTQLECAARGYRWRDVVDGQVAYLRYVMEAAKREGIPEEMIAAEFLKGLPTNGRPAARTETNRLNGLFSSNGVH